MFVPLSEIATVSLGYKSLQNNFFYVNKATIDTFGIERKYLIPVAMLAELDAQSYCQQPEPTTWLFACREKKADLRGTGALRYIEAMGERSAAEKKQTGKSQTIREALEAQSGGLWYAPKAKPNQHHIWLRKAFNSVFAPFLFEKASLIDQRCNSVKPLEGFVWKEVAAALTSSLFVYSLEINGAASMGAGALEAPTTKLRTYPILDLRELKSPARKKLVALAEAVWNTEAPIDWSQQGDDPSPHLRALDEWIIGTAGKNVTTKRLYADIREVCQSRLTVAKDKVKKTKKKKTDNIGNVAASIALGIAPLVQSKNFPEDFAVGASLDVSFNVDRGNLRQITISHLLDRSDIQLVADDGSIIYEATLQQPVAESIVRALLWGRSAFRVSSNRAEMDDAITAFLKWAVKIERDVDAAILESALGTGYEEALKRAVYGRLGIHPLAAAKSLPAAISFAPQS